jgi:AcrR family transcriptional regulator
VLAKEGPNRFTIEAVAKLAGCGKPTIYRWRPSRPALLLEVYEQVVKQELVAHEGKDLAKDLAANLRQVWRLWRKESLGSFYRLILSEMMLEKEGPVICAMSFFRDVRPLPRSRFKRRKIAEKSRRKRTSNF